MPARERRFHQGIGFDLWTGDQSWFWKLTDHNAIGAALSQPQAVSEACIAIDELLRRTPNFDSATACETQQDRWLCALDRLAEHIATA